MSDIDDLARLYRTNRQAYLKAMKQRDAAAAARQYMNTAQQQGQGYLSGLGGIAGLMGAAAQGGGLNVPSQYPAPTPAPVVVSPLPKTEAKTEPLSDHHRKHEEWLDKLRSRPNAKS